MSPNILITGASGYLGGSLIADILAQNGSPLESSQIIAGYRTPEQAQSLSKLGIKLVELDTNNPKAVREAIIDNEVDVVVNNTGAWMIPVMESMIEALGQRRSQHGRDVYLIQSSIATTFSPEAGWTYGDIKDTDTTILQKEKAIGLEHPVRAANVRMTELGQELGVKTLIMALPHVYGRGGGEIRKLSVNLPAHIRAAIADKIVYKFDRDGTQVGAHISDVTALYRLLLEKIVRQEPVPSGEDGYYWVVAHLVPHWKTIQSLAEALYARGLVSQPEVKMWASDAMAGEHLQFPAQFVFAMIAATPTMIPAKARELGWRPKWDEEMFLSSMENEVRDVLEVDTVKSNLFTSFTDK